MSTTGSVRARPAGAPRRAVRFTHEPFVTTRMDDRGDGDIVRIGRVTSLPFDPPLELSPEAAAT